MKASELKPRAVVSEIILEIVSKAEPRQFASDKGTGRVCSAAGKDEDGAEISVSLWNEQCDQVKEGNTIKIEGGWCSEYQGQKQVSTGKFGKLTIVK